jgi:hypothetical protein
MICHPGLDSKNYWDQTLCGEIPEIPCPECESSLRGHGTYQRYLGGTQVSIRRLRCPRCRVTHALLPEDVCAYQDLTLPVLEQVAERAEDVIRWPLEKKSGC